MTNSWLNPADVERVEVFCEDQLIGDFSSLPPDSDGLQYTLTDRGVDTFWTQITYLYNGQPSYATNYYRAVIVPEPGTMGPLFGGSLSTFLRRRRPG